MNERVARILDAVSVGLINGSMLGVIAGLFGGRLPEAMLGFPLIGALAGLAVGGLSSNLFKERSWMEGVAIGFVATGVFITSTFPLLLATSRLSPGTMSLAGSSILLGASLWILVTGVTGGLLLKLRLSSVWSGDRHS